jgi:glutamate-1-semialdehyde 2,1-aminomutase
MAAGLATLALTEAPGFYDRLAATARALTQGLQQAAKEAGVAFSAASEGGMFGLYFAEQVPGSYADVMACDVERFNRFFHGMLDEGFYFAPSAFEAGFVSSAHQPSDIEATITAAGKVFATIR